MPTLLELLESHKNNPKDKRKFGLVLQGGGMRGVYGSAAVAALLGNGLAGAFDHIVGSSAGALDGACFLALDEKSLMDVYSRDQANKNFANLPRRERKMDIDYLSGMILKRKRPFDVKVFDKSKTKLHIIMTDVKTGHKVAVTKHRHLVELYEELRGTAASQLPLYDKPVLIGDRWYMDGGAADKLPLDVAVNQGCTDIMVIMTRQARSYHFDRRHDRLIKYLLRPNRKFRVYVLEPSDESVLISQASTDKPEVEALARLGIADMEAFLHKELPA